MAIKISASTNPPKLEDLNDYILKLNQTDVDYIHCDVMDGRFVKAKTFKAKKVKELKTLTDKPLDVHLMVKNPGCKIKAYAKAGAHIITIHYESVKNKNKLIALLQKIKKYGAFAGLSFNPTTSVLEILPYIYFCDMLLVMSVVPGKSGQEFMTETLLRLETINKFLKKQKMDVVVEVDGGVNDKNVPLLIERDVDSVVMGSYLYKSENLSETIAKIKNQQSNKTDTKEKPVKTTKTKKAKAKKASK
ncbi:MAG: ribulose-phosphate 3-epimerase [Clostridia bacterium]|nr:ribulose-phosphate 3-epimerase [Clostridia bacterium]